MATKKLVVEIVGDSKGIERALGRSEQRMKKFGATSSKTSSALSGHMRNAAKAAAGAAAAYAGIAGAKKAINTTEDLAKTTLSLHNNLGLSVKTASELGAVLKTRGADTKSVNMAFASLSKNVEAAKKGTASAADAFTALGVSQRELKMLKPDQLLNQVADGMAKLGPGTERTAITTKLFGRGWQTLGPLLRGGSAALKEQLDLADKLGASFSGMSVEEINKLIKAQRDAKLASLGLQIAFGTQVAPALTKMIEGATQASLAFRGLASNVKLAVASGVGIAGVAAAFGPWGAAAAAAAGAVFLLVKNWDQVGPAVQRAVGFSTKDVERLRQAATNAWTGIREVTARVWPGVRQVIQGQLRVVGGIVKVFLAILTGDFRGAWNGIKQIVSGALKTIGGYIRAATAPLRAAAAAAFGPIRSAISSVMRGAAKIVGDVIAGMLRRFAALVDVASHIPIIGRRFKGIADHVRDAARKVDGFGEAVSKLPKSRTVKVTLKMALRDIKGTVNPFGGSGMEVDAGIQKASQEYAASNRNRFASLFAGEPGTLGHAKGNLGKAEGIAHRFGLQTTSGFRPGDPGWHGKNRARDFSDGVSTPHELAFAKYMASHFGSNLLELIHTPLGYGIKNGKRVPNSFYASVLPAHYNHVHVAMAKGGFTRQPVRALVGEEGPEIVDLPQGARVHPFSRSKRMVAAMGGMLPGFASGGAVTAAKAAFQAGFRGNRLLQMMMIAGRESGYNPSAQNLNAGTGDHSIGLWQINQLAHHGRFGTDAQLKNPFRNARAAWSLYKAAGLQPWHGMVNTARFKGAAQRAIAALGRGGSRGRSRPRRLLEDHAKSLEGEKRSPVAAFGVPPKGPAKGHPLAIKGQPFPIKGRPFTPERIERGSAQPFAPEGAGGDAQESLAQSLRDHIAAIEALKASIDEQNRYANAVQSVTAQTATRALANVLTAELGPRLAVQMQSAGSADVKARY